MYRKAIGFALVAVVLLATAYYRILVPDCLPLY